MTAIGLNGATVVVTDASRGFARATAVALAESGAQVVGVARHPAARADQPGSSARARRRTKLTLAFRSRRPKEPNGALYTAMCGFRKQAPIAVAPGYVLEVLHCRRSRTRDGVGRPDLLWDHKAEVTMRSAKNNLREAEDSVLSLSASTEVHRWPPLAVLALSSFTAIARPFGARALWEPRAEPVGWRCVVFTPEAGVLV